MLQLQEKAISKGLNVSWRQALSSPVAGADPKILRASVHLYVFLHWCIGAPLSIWLTDVLGPYYSAAVG